MHTSHTFEDHSTISRTTVTIVLMERVVGLTVIGPISLNGLGLKGPSVHSLMRGIRGESSTYRERRHRRFVSRFRSRICSRLLRSTPPVFRSCASFLVFPIESSPSL